LEKKMGNEMKALQHELDELQDQIIAMETMVEEKPDSSSPAITRWQLDRAFLQRLKERAAELEETLSQINADEEEYGVCIQCGEPIHPDRLAVLPGVQKCVRCTRAEEHGAVPRAIEMETEAQA
jgi:DnaK suppressor protein